MIDICFVGNSSIDFIKNALGFQKVYGGSAIYSALSCRSSSSKKIGIVSEVNNELKVLLDKKNIELFGNTVNEINMFEIDEELGICIFKNKVKASNKTPKIDTDYLHVSFRKGVDIDGILNNDTISYNHLSIDVMIHSVESFIPIIQKYKNKIDILFCNSMEYKIIAEYIKEIPMIVITNQNNPVIVIENNKNMGYSVPQSVVPVSTTGAGDSFIGGFLAKYSENQRVPDSVTEGIKNASLSITKYGALFEKENFEFTPEQFELPKNIIVIGNSCAGKTTFINFIKQQFDIYADIDDLPPLLEMFNIDDLVTEGKIEELKALKDKIVYIKDIYDEYLMSYPNVKHYSTKSKDGNGHDILIPNLWDIILSRSVAILKKPNNIIQFSRGRDSEYEKMHAENVYERSLKIILDELTNHDNTIIVYLVSNLEVRKKRNVIRYQRGGHFVSEKTMDSVYKDDIFQFNQTHDNGGVININGIDYPIYVINNNKMLSEIELKEFLMYNLMEIIKKFNNFKENEKNGNEKNSKKNLAKQIKQRV